MNNREEIINSIGKDELNNLELKISKSIKHVLDTYEIEPENQDDINSVILNALYSMVLEREDSTNIDYHISRIKSDFENPKSERAKNSILMLVGYAVALGEGNKETRHDLMQITGSAFQNKYSSN